MGTLIINGGCVVKDIEFNEGDRVIYHGNYECLSNDCVGQAGAVIEIDEYASYNATRGMQSVYVRFDNHGLNGGRGRRGIISANLCPEKPVPSAWEL